MKLVAFLYFCSLLSFLIVFGAQIVWIRLLVDLFITLFDQVSEVKIVIVTVSNVFPYPERKSGNCRCMLLKQLFS